MFELESDNPGADLIAQGHTAFALEEITPPPPPVELPRGGENSPMVLTVAQLAEQLQIGQDRAYNLCHVDGFPAVRIGRNIRINRACLQDWLDRNNGGMIL